MTEKPTYQNKLGKIIEMDKSAITIEDTYGKKHIFALESQGKIHRMLETANPGDAGEYNNRKDGFLVFWKTTKAAPENTVQTVNTSAPPAQETVQRATAAGFNMDAQKVIATEKERGDQRIQENAEDTIEIIEDRIRAVTKTLLPTERGYCRIAMMSALNTAIEIRAQSNDEKKSLKDTKREVKEEALSLFLWTDSLTTGLFK